MLRAAQQWVWSVMPQPPRHPSPMTATRPRNQLYLDQEVAGIWRPLAVSGCAEHSRQVALQGDVQALAIGLEHDGLDECSNGVRRARPTVLALQRQTELPTFSR
jgi:hypothetical protein